MLAEVTQLEGNGVLMVRVLTPRQAVWFAGLLLVVACGTASADQQALPQQAAPAQTQVQSMSPAPATVTRSTMSPVYSSAQVANDECEGGWRNCWLVRACRIHHHDKCMWHWYIRGNGPAIHTRPAAIYWW